MRRIKYPFYLSVFIAVLIFTAAFRQNDTQTVIQTVVELPKVIETAEIKEPAGSEELSVHFIDVGQGDSILIVCGDKTMLIDAGESENSDTVISYIEGLSVEQLDIAVITHPHSDHIGGMIGVVTHFNTGDIYMPRVQANTRVFEDLLDAILAKGLSVRSPAPGDSVMLGSAEITFFGPVEIDEGNLNNCSIVLKITYGEKRFLFMGDAETDEESDILQSGADVSADVLKVGHHGSETSTGSGFLQAVLPENAVISVGGDNNYGHPDGDTLAKLAAAGAKVYRTDLSGNIIITTDGNTFEISVSGNTDIEMNDSETAAVTVESQYIGNVNSRKFHLLSCSSLPAERNRVFFDTAEEAVDSGFSPCARCNPTGGR